MSLGSNKTKPVLPAHAGMILRITVTCKDCESAPRARGDDPPPIYNGTGADECSPRTRG